MSTITTNIKSLEKDFTDLEKKQIPFASSLALNKTLTKAKKSVINDIESKLTIRNKWLARSPIGIKAKFSNKKDLTGAITSKADFLNYHIDGGTRTSNRVGGHMAIATTNVRKNFSKKITKAKRPRNLKNTFVVKEDDGTELLIQRRTRKTKTKRRRKSRLPYGGNKVMYILKSIVHQKKRISPRTVVEKVFARNFNKEFDKAIDYAMWN
jgi:hypothetical protein